MDGGQAFFAFAATLIPALLFGGLISDRLSPPARTSRWFGVGMFIVPVAAPVVLFAEVVAIQAVISGDPTPVARTVVPATVIGLSILALALLVAPWVEAMPKGRHRTAGAVVLTIGALIAGTQGVQLLEESIRTSQLAKADREANRALRAWAEAVQGETAAAARYFVTSRRAGESRADYRERRLLAKLERERWRGRREILEVDMKYATERRNDVAG